MTDSDAQAKQATAREQLELTREHTELLRQQIATERSGQTQERLRESMAGSLRAAQESRREEIREQFGKFILEGQDLLHRCTQEHWPVPEDDANAWATKVEAFLTETLGASYVARFRSTAGLPLTVSSIQSPTRRNLWSDIDARLARLEQFSQELSQ